MSYILRGAFTCTSNLYIPPITFTSPILIIKATSPTAKATWRRAAALYQFVSDSTFTHIYRPTRYFLPLGKACEYTFAYTSDSYQLQFDLPTWIMPSELTISIWE